MQLAALALKIVEGEERFVDELLIYTKEDSKDCILYDGKNMVHPKILRKMRTTFNTILSRIFGSITGLMD